MKSGGSSIDDFRYSPYHPAFENETYANFKNWRKPSPGMILDIMKSGRLIILDPLIGDRQSDIKAAEAANIAGFLFNGGDLLTFVEAILASR